LCIVKGKVHRERIAGKYVKIKFTVACEHPEFEISDDNSFKLSRLGVAFYPITKKAALISSFFLSINMRIF
jgi:hypothetical protein